MRLNNEAIEELRKIYSREVGREISTKKARELAETLLSVFKIICRPVPEKEREKGDSDTFKLR